MTSAWTINVGGRLYGPYSAERLRSFASEGRLAPTSLIAHEGASDWREAREEIDVKSHSSGGLEQAIMSLGSAHRLVHNVWILSTQQTVNAVRNRLVSELGKSDSLFVVDASRGKAAWFNFGPDADVRIRRVWQKAS